MQIRIQFDTDNSAASSSSHLLLLLKDNLGSYQHAIEYWKLLSILFVCLCDVQSVGANRQPSVSLLLLMSCQYKCCAGLLDRILHICEVLRSKVLFSCYYF